MPRTPFPLGHSTPAYLAARGSWLAWVAVPGLCALAIAGAVQAQTSPAFGALPASPAATPGDDIALADYLGLLRQIAPAAEHGARTYLAGAQLRCGRTLSTAELRRAMSQDSGDPVLMGMIRAAHVNDTAARYQLVAQIRCPAGETQ